jgi:hypothetical protein
MSGRSLTRPPSFHLRTVVELHTILSLENQVSRGENLEMAHVNIQFGTWSEEAFLEFNLDGA